MENKLTSGQYIALLELYHEYREAFDALPESFKVKFYQRLYAK
jgi:hypothetical protein